VSNQCWILVGRIVDGNTTKKYILASNNGQYNQITKQGLARFFRENTVLNASASNNSIQCKGMSATQLPKYTMDKQLGMMQVSGLSEQEIIEMSQPLIQEWQAKQIRKTQGNQDDSKLQYIINKLDIIKALVDNSIQMKELTNALAEDGELTRYLKQIDIDNADGDSIESLVKNKGVNGLADGLQNRLKNLHNRAQKYNLQNKEYNGVTISKACSILNKQCEEIRKLHIETKKIIKLNKLQETNEKEQESNNDEELVKVEIDNNINEDISFDDVEEIKEEDIVTVDLDKISEEELDFDKIEDISKEEENTEEKEIEDIIKKIRHRITEDINKPFDTSKMYKALKECLKYITKENYKRFIDNENNDITLSIQMFLNKQVLINRFECTVNSNNDACHVNVCNSSYEIGNAIYNNASYSNELKTGMFGSKRHNIIDEGIKDKQIEIGDKCLHKLERNLSKFATSVYLDYKKAEQERIRKENKENKDKESRMALIEKYCKDDWYSAGWSYAHAYEMDDTHNEGYFAAQDKSIEKYMNMTDEEFDSTLVELEKEYKERNVRKKFKAVKIDLEHIFLLEIIEMAKNGTPGVIIKPDYDTYRKYVSVNNSILKELVCNDTNIKNVLYNDDISIEDTKKIIAGLREEKEVYLDTVRSEYLENAINEFNQCIINGGYKIDKHFGIYELSWENEKVLKNILTELSLLQTPGRLYKHYTHSWIETKYGWPKEPDLDRLYLDLKSDYYIRNILQE